MLPDAISLPWLRHRRAVAAGLAALTMLLAIRAVSAQRGGVALYVAAADLLAGSRLGPGDVVVRHLPAADVPSGAVTAPPFGQTLAAALRRGTPLTDVDLAAGAAVPPGLVATTVDVTDPAALTMLSVGDLVDILAARAPADGAAQVALVAGPVRVLDIPASDPQAAGAAAALVVAVSPGQALRLAAAAVSAHLTLVVEGGP